MSLLLVLVGGAIGAPARFLVDRAVMRGRPGAMPWGTFVVNVAGSLALGIIVGSLSGAMSAAPLHSDPWRLLLGTGFSGALTTYSTFSFENVRLLEEGRMRLALANIAGTLITTCAAVAAGLALGAALSPAPGSLLGLAAGG